MDMTMEPTLRQPAPSDFRQMKLVIKDSETSIFCTVFCRETNCYTDTERSRWQRLEPLCTSCVNIAAVFLSK